MNNAQLVGRFCIIPYLVSNPFIGGLECSIVTLQIAGPLADIVGPFSYIGHRD